MNIFLLMGFAMIFIFEGFLWWIERMKVKRIEEFIGSDFTRAIYKGGDGILLQVIDESRDADFTFVPFNHMDNKFYYVEFPYEEGDKKYHYKITKKDTFTLRNKLRVALVLKESMRALNINHIASYQGLPDGIKRELLEDYTQYHTLKELYNKLSKSLAVAKDMLEIKENIEQMKQIREEMEKLKEKWKQGVVQVYDKDKVLLIQDDDSDYVTVVRSIDLDEIDDTTTGVHPTEIYNTAIGMFLDWYKEELREFGNMLIKAKSRIQQGSVMKWLLMIGGGLVGIIVVVTMFLK